MTGALSAREADQLADDLERQGARIRRTSKGYRALGPEGLTAGWHRTASDSRSALNLRADIRKMGYEWPWDGRKSSKVSAEQQTEVPDQESGKPEYADYITRLKKRPSDALIASVRGSILRLVKEEFTAQEVLTLVGTQNIVGVTRTMFWLGCRYVPGSQYRPHSGRLWHIVPELDRSKQETLPQRQIVHVKEKPPLPAKPKAVEHASAEIVSLRVAAPLPPSGLPRGPEREVLDTYDSWAVPLERVQGRSLEEVIETLKAFGLQAEIRVWHE